MNEEVCEVCKQALPISITPEEGRVSRRDTPYLRRRLGKNEIWICLDCLWIMIDEAVHQESFEEVGRND
jgi:hypothetical protein